MTRIARSYSESGFVHVIMRGIGKQVLFESPDDYRHFIDLVKKYCEELNVKVNAYCLMDNHVHLLLHDDSHELSVYMKKIGVSYAWYYNSKYDRSGHLFQDRFKSIPIESERQLLTTFRYILQNPEKAGICKACDYQWSSYVDFGRYGSFTDTDIFEDLIGSCEDFEKFMTIKEEPQFSEFGSIKRNDAAAHAIMMMALGVDSGTVLQKYSKSERNKALRTLKENGLSIRQIERMTGIGRSIIQRA